MKASKDQQALVDLLLDIENRFDVNAIKLDEVHLWPIVRLTIGRAFKFSDPISDAGISSGANKTPDARSPATGTAKSVDGFPRNKVERTALHREHRRQVKASAYDLDTLVAGQWELAERLRGTDFLILSKIEKYYELYNGRRYAPIIDPVYEDLKKRGKAQSLALAPLPVPCLNEPTVFDIEPFLLSRPQPALSLSAEGRRMLEEINRFIRQKNEVYCFDPDYIVTRFWRIRHRADFYRQFFSIVRPKAIFLSSFTGWMHAVLGAKEAGIPTVDVQHGGQGPIHYPTTHYSSIPVQGYELLPDVFWLWSAMNKEYAAKWLPGGADCHIPVVGGNRKVAQWYRRRDEGKLDDIDRKFVDTYKGRTNVLVTLSYGVEKLMPDQLVEAIGSVKDVLWHVRLHPIHRTEEAISQISHFMQQQGIENVVVEDPTFVQLPTALSVCCAHITPFSTSGTEAVAMGVPTLMCDEIGAGLFREEIEAGVFSFADSAGQIAEWVRACRERSEQQTEFHNRYVEISEAAVDRVLETVTHIQPAELQSGRSQPPAPAPERKSGLAGKLWRALAGR